MESQAPEKWYANTALVIVLLILFFPIGLLLMWFKTQWLKPVKWIVTAIFALILFGDVFFFSHASALPTENKPVITKAQLTTTSIPTKNPVSLTPTKILTSTDTPVPTLSYSQKSQVVAMVTTNTNHFKQLWIDGQTALGTTQYANGSDGLVALNDPNSNASKFSQYKQKENPANDNSMNDTLTQADKLYPRNVSDDALNNWRMDMTQLSSDMGLWVNDATGWQISTVPTSTLNSDAQKIEKDFSLIQEDIQKIL